MVVKSLNGAGRAGLVKRAGVVPLDYPAISFEDLAKIEDKYISPFELMSKAPMLL